jgi:hypothetical protein
MFIDKECKNLVVQLDSDGKIATWYCELLKDIDDYEENCGRCKCPIGKCKETYENTAVFNPNTKFTVICNEKDYLQEIGTDSLSILSDTDRLICEKYLLGFYIMRREHCGEDFSLPQSLTIEYLAGRKSMLSIRRYLQLTIPCELRGTSLFVTLSILSKLHGEVAAITCANLLWGQSASRSSNLQNFFEMCDVYYLEHRKEIEIAIRGVRENIDEIHKKVRELREAAINKTAEFN